MVSDFLDSWVNKESHIIIFPGVFDPIHLGHISAAKAAIHYGGKLLILPERNPYRKQPQACYSDRLAMVEAAVADIPNMEVCSYIKERFEIETTLAWLQLQYPGFKFLFLMGEDVVNLMPTWKNIDKMGELGVDRLLVVRRQNDDLTKRLSDISGVAVSYIVRTMHEHEEVSSTKIRTDVSKFQNLLPEQVFEYITDQKIYES